jgi:hypothetical protein
MAEDVFPDFNRMSNDFYKQWESAMTRWWDQALESPAFLDAMGKNAAGYAKGRGAWQKSMDEMAERMHVPGKGDMVRLARICTLLEEKLLSQEDRLLSMQDRLDALEKEVVQSRIEAAEARLEQREALSRIEALLQPRHEDPRRRKSAE